MQFLNKMWQNYKNDRNKIAYLASLTLLFSYAETILPRVVPFFRLGLSNIAILASFSLSFPSFLFLTVLKAISASLMSGTLFSPFFVISLSQSVFSGVLMYALFYLNKLCNEKLFSIYGISVLGSVFSGAIQISLASVYLGQGTYSLLGPVLIFNAISGIITAILVQVLDILGGESLPLSRKRKPCLRLLSTLSSGAENQFDSCPATPRDVCVANSISTPQSNKTFNIILISAIILLSIIIFLIRSIPVLCAFLVFSFLLQILCKRKIRILPHISLWIFVLVSTIFVPNGKVLFSFWNISITEGALFLGIEKALRLSAVSALSQAAASIKLPESNILGLTLFYYRTLSDKMRSSSGNIFARLKNAISLQNF